MKRWVREGALCATLVVSLCACGDDTSTTGTTGTGGGDTGGAGPSTASTGGGTTTGTGGSGGAVTGTGGTGTGGTGMGGGGGGPIVCDLTASEATRGAAIAVSENDDLVVAANRDSGTVSVFGFDAAGPTLVKDAELTVGAEPWQVAIDPCGTRAFVVSRGDQKVVAIDALDTAPVVGGSVSVGSEPTALVLSPNGTRLYVTSWVDGTVAVIDTATMTVTDTIDLNDTLAATGLLGDSVTTGRPALAHPRSIAMTNDGDGDDSDEIIVVNEFFAQRTAPELDDLSNVDTNWVGLVYRIDASTNAATTVGLRSLASAGFGTAGCFPNQLQSVTVRGDQAYVTSICAAPAPPAAATGMTFPVLSVVDLSSGTELAASPTNLAKSMASLYDAAALAPNSAGRRLPLVANDLAFDPTSGAAYVTANGVDAVFRAIVDDATGAVTSVGAGASKPFVDLAPASFALAAQGQNPNGLAFAHGSTYAFVINDVSRSVSVLDLDPGVQKVAGGGTPVVVESSAQPTVAADQAWLRGKRAFNTGLGRFSQDGQGWGACQSCHFEGLSDNVTWYLGRGPRQSTSLEGSYATGDPTDHRIFNWTAVNDEIYDFEGVLRSLDGGVGAMVHTIGDPPVNANRVDLAAAGAAGLNGSAELAMDQLSLLLTWDDLAVFIQEIRSPKKPTNLDATKVAAGAALFSGAGSCQGCHGGAKWTISEDFYTPSTATTDALKLKAWDGATIVAAGFPAELLPATTGNQFMRFAAAGGDQIQCVLRNVGTFAVSPADVHVVEKNAGGGVAQGNMDDGKGYNVPSILGMSVGAPYFHAGNARTLEELFDTTFAAHHEAVAASGFLTGGTATQDRDALIAYLLSIDESTAPLTVPALGAQGGVFCAAP
jgi:YVTN family beta-propeller protein